MDSDILHCIHIGLLCVQGTAKQRPTMSSVMIMLGSETEVLLSPQTPGFFLERGHISHSPSGDRDTHGSNVCSITVIEGR